MRAGGAVVEPVDRGFGAEQRGLRLFDEVVRRKPALGLAPVHRTAHDVQPHPDADPGGGERFDLVSAVTREDVVVVGDGGAAGGREPRETRRGGGVRDLGVEPAPDRVQRDQPFEEGVIGGEAARGPLVEVVMGVDQTGRDQAAGAVDAFVVVAVGCLPRADRRDAVVLEDDVARGVLGTRSVDRGDRGVLDDGLHVVSTLVAANRTASRIFS